MNKLAAAIYITSMGIPFIHAGEEFLRIKEDEHGKIIENSYNSSDFVNKIRWNCLEEKIHADTAEYYKGLIKFRKTHSALHISAAEEVISNVKYWKIGDGVVLFIIEGEKELVVIFNASEDNQMISLKEYDIKDGNWEICVNGECADMKEKVTDQCVNVVPISAMILVKG